MYTWITLQNEVGAWVKKNFPESPARHQVWGLIEELGELVHSHLKMEQGIRGSTEKHIAAGKDAVADSLIFFMSACTLHGWEAQRVLVSGSPEEFQDSFATLERVSEPRGRSSVTYTIVGLARMVEELEDASLTTNPEEKEAHMASAKRAAVLYIAGLAAHCTSMRWSMQQIVEEVWPKVQQRDWTKNKVTGGDLDAVIAK